MGCGPHMVNDEAYMNLIDDITELIRTTPIVKLDLTFAKAIDPMKAYEGLELRPEYRVLIDTMTQLYMRGMTLGIPPERAGAAVLGVFEEIIRYVVTKSVKEYMSSRLAVGDLQAIHEIVNARDESVKVENLEKQKVGLEARKTELEAELFRKSRAMRIDQFKSHLLYAADRWGKPGEQRMIKAMVARMPDRDAELKEQKHESVS